MLFVLKTIAQSFKSNIQELSVIKSNWTTDYADDLVLRIDDIIEQQLGVNSLMKLRKATSNLDALVSSANKELTFFKRLIESSYKEDVVRKKEILNDLGFIKNHRFASQKKQEALIYLLYTFKTNFNEVLRAELKSKGFYDSIIDNIIEKAKLIEEANNVQENNKLYSKEITFNKRKVYNELYNEIMSICVLAASHFRNLPAKKTMFTFSKIVKQMSKKQKSNNKIVDVAKDEQNVEDENINIEYNNDTDNQ